MGAPVGPTAALLGESGLMFPWVAGNRSVPLIGSSSNSSSILDRFHLGGARNLRGFAEDGVGPRAEPSSGGLVFGDALGGDLKLLASAMLSTPVPAPALAEAGIRATASLRAGLLGSRVPTDAGDFFKLSHLVRSTVSLGLCVPVNQGAILELSCAKPLTSQPQDRGEQWQLSIGLGLG